MSLIGMFRSGEKFIGVFKLMTQNLTNACELLEKFLVDLAPDKAVAIKQLERRGDELVKDVVQRLDVTFITPFDREDIHRLAQIVDDVLDLVHRVSARTVMYRIQRQVPGSMELARLLTQSSHELQDAVTKLHENKEVLRHCERVNELEHEGDVIYATTMRALFDNISDAIELIKLKEVLETVEAALNRAEDVADVIESIVIKNS